MSRINVVMYQGKIYKIEEKQVKGGKKCCEIRLRQSYPKVPGRKLDNPTQDDFRTEWVTAVCWGDTATLALDTLQANDYVCVQGRLRYEEWQDRDSGKTRSKHTIVASYLHRTPGTYKDTVSNKLTANNSFAEDSPF